MRKKIQWENPNKMHINTGFKTFDKQTTLITTGNVIAPTQTSWYIRPFNEIKNGGYIGKPGEFLAYDLKHFIGGVPEHMKKLLWDKDRTESYILYEFFVRVKHVKQTVGYVLTDSSYHYISSTVICPSGCDFYKRNAALTEAMKYICEED